MAMKTVKQFAEPATVQKVCKDDQWNELIVVARGSRLIQTVNGTLLAELVDEQSHAFQPRGAARAAGSWEGNGGGVQGYSTETSSAD